MPELPEVETIRRQIETHLLGEKISAVTVLWEPVIRGHLVDVLLGQSLIAVERFGKLLVIHCSSTVSVCVHLKMTGRLSALTKDDVTPSHTRIIFHLQSGKILAFSDSRKFGYVHIIQTQEVKNLRFVHTLGKEPLKDLQFEDFFTLTQRTKRPIKTLLLDQTRIAGIGNIYACEALWMAKINPVQPSTTLSKSEAKKLFMAIEEVLAEGIRRGGASDNTYRDLTGKKGKYQNFFKVYGQAGKPCKRCGTVIIRSTVGGRGTFFCPNCQS